MELILTGEKSKKALLNSENGEIAVVTAKEMFRGEASQENLYRVGVLGNFRKMKELDDRDEIFKIIFEPKQRIRVEKFIQTEPFILISYTLIKKEKQSSESTIVLKNTLIENINRLVGSGRPIPVDVLIKIIASNDTDDIIDGIIPFTDGSVDEKQKVLEEENVLERIRLANELVSRTARIGELEKKVADETKNELSRAQKEVFLREEMKAIQKELGDESGNDIEEMRKKISNSGMPTEAEQTAIKELNRLQKTASFSPEISYIRNYLDWLINLPWQKATPSQIDLKNSKSILDDDHYGLEKIKQRIIEYLAVQKLTAAIKGPILCFVGPPGTGKTSIGKSIARSMGRKFTRVSLGGIHDEAEIRGHRRTYVGAMPGRIIQSINQIQSRNPIFMLDEIDKVGRDFRGDPTSSLLEVLDPEQNNHFSDHYLEVQFDLSDVMFIATANSLETISKPLLDRMEIIEFSGYSPEEKLEIAKRFIIPKVLTSHGLGNVNFKIKDEAISAIISEYTQEAGVRNLEREISKIARKIALFYAQGDEFSKEIGKGELAEFLGSPKVDYFMKNEAGHVGIGSGLAVTEAGGEVIVVEALEIPNGKGKLILTGNMGEIMKESAKTALSYVRSISQEYSINPEVFSKSDIHLHIPRGATPKDGPSAGGIIAITILSALTKVPINNLIGMTGEITLQGNILKIGGVKEKILAAKRFGLKKVILPRANEGDLREIPKRNIEGIDFILTDSMQKILPIAFRKGTE